MNYLAMWDEMIEKRNRLLSASDWTQVPDSPLSDAKKAEWATYRKALRDIPQQFPEDFDKETMSPFASNPFPTKPE